MNKVMFFYMSFLLVPGVMLAMEKKEQSNKLLRAGTILLRNCTVDIDEGSNKTGHEIFKNWHCVVEKPKAKQDASVVTQGKLGYESDTFTVLQPESGKQEKEVSVKSAIGVKAMAENFDREFDPAFDFEKVDDDPAWDFEKMEVSKDKGETKKAS